MRNVTQKTSRFWSWLFVGIGIFGMLALPVCKILTMLTGFSVCLTIPLNENRHLAPRPDFAKLPVKEWGGAVDAWYQDHFAFRSELIRIYRDLLFHPFRTGTGRDVPGTGKWLFRRGGDWPEMESYMGALKLTPEELENWRILFEGRSAWAEAIGSHYVQLLTATKSQIQVNELPLPVRAHRGEDAGSQFLRYLEEKGSFARTNIVFVSEIWQDAYARGNDLFYDEDHHPNAYGMYLLYQCLHEHLSTCWPGRLNQMMPFYGKNPPEAVMRGTAPGCWVKDSRLAVSSPGMQQDTEQLLRIGKRYPYCNAHLYSEHPGEGLSLVMAHDSFMRFSLSSWEETPGSVRLPVDAAFTEIFSYIFEIYSPGFLDSVTRDSIPDVLLEQFQEMRLSYRAQPRAVRPDAHMQAASVFQNKKLCHEAFRAVENTVREIDFVLPASLWDGTPEFSGSELSLRFVFSQLEPENETRERYPRIRVSLLRNGVPWPGKGGSAEMIAGPRRPWFLPAFPLSSLTPEDRLTLRLEGGGCTNVQLSVRR